MAAEPAAYGALAAAERLDGAALLQADEERRAAGESSDGSDWEERLLAGAGSEGHEGESGYEGESGDESSGSGDEGEEGSSGSDEGEEGSSGSEEGEGELSSQEGGSGDGQRGLAGGEVSNSASESDGDGDGDGDGASDPQVERKGRDVPSSAAARPSKIERQTGSLGDLRKQLAAAQAAKQQQQTLPEDGQPLPLEMTRILDESDFSRMRYAARRRGGAGGVCEGRGRGRMGEHERACAAMCACRLQCSRCRAATAAQHQFPALPLLPPPLLPL